MHDGQPNLMKPNAKKARSKELVVAEITNQRMDS